MRKLLIQILIIQVFIFITVLYPQETIPDSSANFYNYLNDLSSRIKNQNTDKNELQGEIEALKMHFPKSEIAEKDSVLSLLQNLLNNRQNKNTGIYIVKLGDCLWNIAKRDTNYRNPYDWIKIFNANKEKIKNPDMIYPNQKLKIFVKKNNILPVISNTANNPDTARQVVEEKPKVINSDDIEIQGLIVDQTQTKLGHDFYDVFYDNWQPPQNSGNFTIVIDEKPLPQLGTQVTIKINDNDVFQQMLQPKYDTIVETARYGVQVCTAYIENYEQIQKQLTGGDMAGTGIY